MTRMIAATRCLERRHTASLIAFASSLADATPLRRRRWAASTSTRRSAERANLLESFGGKLTFSDTTWKAGLEYDVTSASMLYFTASTGFKAGGINQTVAPNNTYQPEKITAYEFGSRNRFFDNRLQVNIEGFYWDYTNQQNHPHHLRQTRATSRSSPKMPAKLRIYGANVDVVAKLTAFDNPASDRRV